MSLVNFKAQNHPQQTRHRGGNDRRWHSTDEVDDRAITVEDFAPLNERFRFTVDAAAADHNARLPHYWTRETDAIAQDWSTERVWCNPPYSDIRPWVEKAWREHNRGAELIVFLLPANRTEQGWWQDLVEPAQRQQLVRVEFLRGRMRFLRRGQTVIGPNERPPFGCVLVIWGGP